MPSKVISTVNFKSGGKSSILRLLAEELQTAIINFDSNRDATIYNKVPTLNVNPKSSIHRKSDGIYIDGKKPIHNEYFLCDFGGYHDSRIGLIKSDIYIIPTFADFETIRESVRMETYLRELHADANLSKPRIIYVLNGLGIGNNKDVVKKATSELQININQIKSEAVILFFPETKLVKKLVNENYTVKDVLDDFFLGRWAYKKVFDFVDELRTHIDRV